MSDIDIVLVWEDEASEEEAEENIASRVSELTGNDCNLLQYTASEFAVLAERRRTCMRRSPLRASIYWELWLDGGTETSRIQPCDRQEAAQRYEQARAFAALAELAPECAEGPTRSAAVSNAVLAALQPQTRSAVVARDVTPPDPYRLFAREPRGEGSVWRHMRPGRPC